MNEEATRGAPQGDIFDAVDPKLNVFALANGMDLNRGPDFRRLEWFTEGLERGILIEAEDEGAYRVGVLSWPTGSDDVSSQASIGTGLSADELVQLLHSAIESANGL